MASDRRPAGRTRSPRPPSGRTGRRPGDRDTKGTILEAARRQFAARGFSGATIRSIAGDAGVDPALVHHYFGTKQQLFAQVLEFPVTPDVVVNTLLGGSLEGAGERIVRTFLSVWDLQEHHERMTIIIRAASTDGAVARMMREFILDSLLTPALQRLGLDQPRRRASLVATQLVGLAFVRYIVRFEPLASASPAEVVADVAPVVQHYLTGDLHTSV